MLRRNPAFQHLAMDRAAVLLHAEEHSYFAVNHVGARFTSLTNLVTLPAYTTVDAALQYTQGKWEVDMNIKNLLNRKYYVSAHGSNDNLILSGSPRALQVTLRTYF